jgi:hypothetical protein
VDGASLSDGTATGSSACVLISEELVTPKRPQIEEKIPRQICRGLKVLR